MSEHIVTFAGRRQVPNVDAQAVYLHVERDSRYLQYVAIVVTDPDLRDRWGIA